MVKTHRFTGIQGAGLQADIPAAPCAFPCRLEHSKAQYRNWRNNNGLESNSDHNEEWLPLTRYGVRAAKESSTGPR
jgi:hypothetical protein